MNQMYWIKMYNGNNVIIKNTIIGDNVRVLDGAVIGKKGFGFFLKKKKIRDIHMVWL